MLHDDAAETGSARRRARVRLALAVLGGLAAGAALTLGLQRARPVARLGATAAVVTDTGGQARPRDPGAALAPGDRVKAGARPTDVVLSSQTSVTLDPRAELTVLKASARIEQGGAVIDATAAIEEVRVATAAGDVIMSSARIELHAAAGGPPLAGGQPGAIALVRVEQGSVRLESAGRELGLGVGERGLLVAGHAPVRTASDVAPAALTSDDDDERRRDRQGAAVHFVSAGPVVVPVTVPAPVPVAVPVGVPVVAVAPRTAAARGVIEGVVDQDGAAPPEPAAPAGCSESGEPAWAVDRGRLGNVYVHISSAVPPQGTKPASEPVVITQRGCAFVPRLAPMLLGQRVEFRAGDGAVHGVRVSAGASALFDAGLSPGRPVAAWTASYEGLLRLHCDLHPSADATVAVSAHPFFAVSASDGTFRITGVPPGRHTLRAWHARGGEKTAEVTVGDGRPAQARFVFEGEKPVAAAPAPPPEPAPPAPPAPAPPAPAPSHDCHVAVAGTSPVAQACAEGGVPRARAVMKEIVQVAHARGLTLECKNCHADERAFALAPQARERLGQLLASLTQPTVYFIPPRFEARAAGSPASRSAGHGKR
jgi:hypothetical protein